MRAIMLFIAVAVLLFPMASMAQTYNTSDLMDAVPPQSPGLPALTPEQGGQVSAQLYYLLEQWATTGDPTAYASQLTSGVTYVRLGDGTYATGVEATIIAMGGVLGLATNVHFQIDRVEVNGRYVVSFGTVTGTLAGASAQLVVSFGHAILINEDSKISIIVDGTDLASLAAQIYIATGVDTETWGEVKYNMRN